jgi:hypothetical protein
VGASSHFFCRHGGVKFSAVLEVMIACGGFALLSFGANWGETQDSCSANSV